MTKFICITQSAARHIISNRELQSNDFEKASSLLDLLFNDSNNNEIGLQAIPCKAGKIIIANGEKFSTEKNTITFDLEGMIQLSNLSSSQKLTVVQKTLRFSIKFWEGLAFNNNEYLPPGSSKAIIFPFPITTSSSLRLTIEREPSKRREIKRYPGMHILAYKFGDQAGEGLNEEYPTTSFKFAMEEVFNQKTYAVHPIEKSEKNLEYAIFDTDEQYNGSAGLASFPDPIKLLSSKQLQFVMADHTKPSRIQGPAGSGKTACLILKALEAINRSLSKNEVPKFLFLCPSIEVAEIVKFNANELNKNKIDPDYIEGCIEITTMQEICVKLLGADISETELLDIDSFESKNTQLLHISSIIEITSEHKEAHKQFISPELYSALFDVESLRSAEMVRHEISTVIKGRCDGNIHTYLEAKRPKYGLPLSSENDRRFIFSIFEKYNKMLDNISQFDIDDVTVSTLAKLDAPLWMRRRSKEGYDAIFIDEVHLFNFNELSLVHYLTKNSKETPLSYTIDVSQALGDIAWSDEDFYNSSRVQNEEKTSLQAVFRCSPSITDLAFSITTHGASIFSNFDNPISDTSYIYNEKSDETPQYLFIENCNDADSIYRIAERLKDEKSLSRSEVCIIAFDRNGYETLSESFSNLKKPITKITKRGDLAAIKEASQKNTYIFAMADYVGGLEFSAVIIVGVDSDRVPPKTAAVNISSKNFQNYMAHNRLYVAVTRARNYVIIIGEKMSKPSLVLESAIENKKISVVS